jgi:hypothetical protein
MSLIDKLLASGYIVRIWDDRYGAGIRAAIGREYDQVFISVCELTDSDDIEAAGFSEYLNNSGDWLPFSCAESSVKALIELEEKLEKLPAVQISKSSKWAEAVDHAYAELNRVATGGYGIASAIDTDTLPSSPIY